MVGVVAAAGGDDVAAFLHISFLSLLLTLSRLLFLVVLALSGIQEAVFVLVLVVLILELIGSECCMKFFIPCTKYIHRLCYVTDLVDSART